MALALKSWKSLCGSLSALSLSRRGGSKGFRVPSVLLAAAAAEDEKLQSLRVDRREGISIIRERDHAQRRRLRCIVVVVVVGIGIGFRNRRKAMGSATILLSPIFSFLKSFFYSYF